MIVETEEDMVQRGIEIMEFCWEQVNRLIVEGPLQGSVMNQIDMLKAAFDRGETLSVAEALTRYGIYALSQRCGELSKSGYPVTTDWETTLSGKHIVRYSKLRVAYG